MSFVISLIVLGTIILVDVLLKIIASPLWLIIIIPSLIWTLYMASKYGGTKKVNGKWVKCDPNERK